MTREEAEAATRNGAIVACISAALTTLYIFLGYLSGTNMFGGISFSALNFLDVILLLGMAYGTYRKSRTAAVVLVAYYVFNVIIITAQNERVSIGGTFLGFGIAFVFLVFYGKAVKGAFVYQRLLAEEGVERKAVPKWVYAIGAVVLTPLIGLFSIALLAIIGVLPSFTVVSEKEMFADDIASLREEGILLPDEEIELFCSYGSFSILEGGNILTRDAVISYATDESGELQIRSIPRGEIANVVRFSSADSISDDVYMVYGVNLDQWLKLKLPSAENGGQRFIDALSVGLNGAS